MFRNVYISAQFLAWSEKPKMVFSWAPLYINIFMIWETQKYYDQNLSLL